MENSNVLTDAELAEVVAGVDVHRGLRERLGMCGCGLYHVEHTA